MVFGQLKLTVEEWAKAEFDAVCVSDEVTFDGLQAFFPQKLPQYYYSADTELTSTCGL